MGRSLKTSTKSSLKNPRFLNFLSFSSVLKHHQEKTVAHSLIMVKMYQVGIVTSDFPGSYTMVSKPPRGPAKTTNWRVMSLALKRYHHLFSELTQLRSLPPTINHNFPDDKEGNAEQQLGWNKLLQNVLQTHSGHHGTDIQLYFGNLFSNLCRENGS